MPADGQRCAAAVRRRVRAFARPLASALVALALGLAPPTAGARGGSPPPSAPLTEEPTPAERKAFRSLRAEMDRADGARDWHLLLTKSGQALAELPEHESSEGERREVVQLVGEHEIDQRSVPQIELSLQILNTYEEQLRRAYGDAATLRPGWEEAERYMGDLRRRLPSTEVPPPRPQAHRATRSPASSPADLPESLGPDRGIGPIAVSGAVLTGVGGALLVAGLASAPRAKHRLDETDDLVRACEQQGAMTCPAADDARAAWRRAVGTTLGLAIPGVVLLGVGVGLLVVGLRRKRLGPARASVNRDGVLIRF